MWIRLPLGDVRTIQETSHSVLGCMHVETTTGPRLVPFAPSAGNLRTAPDSQRHSYSHTSDFSSRRLICESLAWGRHERSQAGDLFLAEHIYV